MSRESVERLSGGFFGDLIRRILRRRDQAAEAATAHGQTLQARAAESQPSAQVDG